MAKFYKIAAVPFLFPLLVFANINLYSNFDSMPPRIVDTLEIPYPLSSYNWYSSVSEDTLSPFFITLHQEYTPLVKEEYRYVWNTLFHGKYSLMVEDTMSDTFAYAVHRFPEVGDKEYMVEFYFWVNRLRGRVYLYDPLFKGEDRGYFLSIRDVKKEYENENLEFEMGCGDNVHIFTYSNPIYKIILHSGSDTMLFFWHKVQLYHHIDNMVSLWVDGDSIGSYFWES